MGNASGAPTAYESTWRQYVASPGGTMDAIDLASALTSTFDVYMTSTQLTMLCYEERIPLDGTVCYEEFCILAEKFAETLPVVATTQRAEERTLFVSFGAESSVGLALIRDPETERIVVETTAGISREADIPPGSVVRYLHDEEISEDATTDDLFAKVAALKKTRAAFTIGFVLPVGATLPVYDTPSVGGAGLFSCQGCMAAS